MIPWKLAPQFQLNNAAPAEQPEDAPKPKGEIQVFERYYHLFKKGELDELIAQIDGFEVIKSIWDADNWYVIAKRTK
jgi:tRNA (uracil-5-)-methyltransferase TRM9